jgi:hypothetical protein
MVPLLIPLRVAKVADIVEQMRRSPAAVRYANLFRVCLACFGPPRQSGTSHAIFKMPWPGDPRENIQNARGKAKPYQVRQVLLAMEKMNWPDGNDGNSKVEKPK